jgi:cytochrome c
VRFHDAVRLFHRTMALLTRDLREHVRFVREVDEPRQHIDLDPRDRRAAVPIPRQFEDLGMRGCDEPMAAHAALDGGNAGERPAPRGAVAVLTFDPIGDHMIAVPEVDRLLGTCGGPGPRRRGGDEQHGRGQPQDRSALAHRSGWDANDGPCRVVQLLLEICSVELMPAFLETLKMRLLLLVSLAPVLYLGGCSGSEIHEAESLTGGSVIRGTAAIDRYGCAACHTIPGIPGANATVGPPLTSVAVRQYLAGHVTNTPANMIKWIQHPRAIDPGTVMPELGVTDQDGKDIAAFLYTLR